MPKPKSKRVAASALQAAAPNSTIVSVRFEVDDLKQVESAANAKGQTVSRFIHEAVSASLDKTFPVKRKSD